MRIKKTAEFMEWFDTLVVKEQVQVDARFQRIEQHNHFGDVRDLGDGLAELRWANGRRVYFTRAMDEHGFLVLVILGGLKNAQKKDIKQAKLLVRRYAGS